MLFYFIFFKAVHIYCVVPKKSAISVHSLFPHMISLANTEASLGDFFGNIITSAIVMKQAFYNNEGHLAVSQERQHVSQERLRIP